jgi:hypothetical protein
MMHITPQRRRKFGVWRVCGSGPGRSRYVLLFRRDLFFLDVTRERMKIIKVLTTFGIALLLEPICYAMLPLKAPDHIRRYFDIAAN